MFPMIISVEEVRKARKILREVQAELKYEGVPFDPKMEVGIMIETPAAALISAELARRTPAIPTPATPPSSPPTRITRWCRAGEGS